MLRLENVSKFYSANGLVSTGFSKVNLQFDMGEFVAITGESGSGKSTLLNVISGLDSYEEGEMYIMGQPTSGFAQLDLEDYRKKYIGNIFQTFNLINSYTVYQNVELILLMSGYNKKDVAPKVKEIIEKVGLSEYEKTKTSKLSGGQKQRVAIARALAKETPIIVADEPTGNLDSQSAAEIIELLHQLSKDKLIIIVTHNYEQVEKFVTRKISMHDGRVAEDKKFNLDGSLDNNLDNNLENNQNTETMQTTESGKQAEPAKADNLSFGNMVRLSGRNTFNIPAKFLLLLVVFLFLCVGTISQYSSYLNMGETSSGVGYSDFFADTSKDRILITKPDKSQFNDGDYEALESMDNVKRVVRNDLILDTQGSIQKDSEGDDGGVYISAKIDDASTYENQLVEGRMPENANEAILIFDKEESYVTHNLETVYNTPVDLNNDSTGNPLINDKITIVGYGYATEEQRQDIQERSHYLEAIVGLNDAGMAAVRESSLEGYCSQEYTLGNVITQGNSGQWLFPIVSSDEVPEGQLYIPEELANTIETSARGRTITVTNKSLYFEDTTEYTVGTVYTKNNLSYWLDRNDFDDITGSIFMNPADYAKMFDKGNFQSSIIVDEVKDVYTTEAALQDAGYETLRVNDGVLDYGAGVSVVINTFRTILLVVVLVVLFFITYFITKLILKSRNTYYSIIRMIGGTKENCRALLRTELFFVFNIAYAICIAGAVLVNKQVIKIDYLYQIITFLEVHDYIILYVVLCIMSLVLATRYAKQLFKKTAMNAHKEEV